MIKLLIWIAVVCAGTFILFSLYIYFNQHKMVFYPTKNFDDGPKQWDLKYQDIFIKINQTESIHGWYFPANDSSVTKTVILCHGNGGNISHRMPTADFFVRNNINFFIFDYRGYGKSDGVPTEENIFEDTKAAFGWVVDEKKITPEDIVLFGRSLGGVPAVRLATQIECGGLIVESSFTSAAEVGKIMFPMMPVKFLLRYQLNSADIIDKVKCPIVVTHSPTDEMIPYEMGLKLFEKAKEPKTFVRLTGGHNERGYLNSQDYKDAIFKLINK